MPEPTIDMERRTLTSELKVYSDGLIVSVDYNGPITTTTISKNKVVGKGIATQDPADTYNRSLGFTLSYLRAIEQYAQKRRKQLVGSLSATTN